MFQVQKNIWKLFTVVVAIGVMLYLSMIYVIYINVKKMHKASQEKLLVAITDSTQSMLSKHGVIMTDVGRNLLRENTYKNTKKGRAIIEETIARNPQILRLGLLSAGGALMASTHTNHEHMDMLEEKEAFQKAQKSDSLIIGRTYFSKRLQQYVVPMQKSIARRDGEIVAVVMASIGVEELVESVKGEDDGLKSNIILFRGKDNFFQAMSNALSEDIYSKKISDLKMDKTYDKLEKSLGLDLEEIKIRQKVGTIEQVSAVDGKKIFITAKYIKEYDLWSVIRTDYPAVMSRYYKSAGILGVVLFSVVFLLYFLFYQLSAMIKKNRTQLMYQAEHDYLTGVYNRYYISKKLSNLDILKPFYMLIVNIDNFKSINNNFGQMFGDLVLKNFADKLQNIIDKESDILSRYGGDEFIIVRFGDDYIKVVDLAKEILARSRDSHTIGGIEVNLSASIGIVNYPADAKAFDELEKYLSITMKEAKRRKNCYLIYNDDLKKKHLRESAIEYELKSALKNEEIFMMYQPQVRNDGKIQGVEALARWSSKKLGNVGPDEFIPIAERSGMMPMLGEFITKKALKDMYEIQKQHSLRLSINISPKQFLEPDFYTLFIKNIEEYGFAKNLVTIEITESLFIDNLEEILVILYKLKSHGVMVSLDDFGTGYSSLSVLNVLPIDELKIDKKFIDTVAKEDLTNMTKSIIFMAKELSIKSLAEGVEECEQKEILNSYGCDFFQGYLFSKPLSREDLLDFI